MQAPAKMVTVKAPATSANLGPGFDVFGLALQQPSDKVTLQVIPEGVKIEVTGILAKTISTVPQRNTAGLVATQMLEQFSLKTGLLLKIEKGIVPGVGLGSSAAAAAAVAYGVNSMFNLGLDYNHLIEFAAKGEVASAGSAHADNVAAAICGNFVIVKSYHPLKVVNLKCPRNMEIAVSIPRIQVPAGKTRKARLAVTKLVPIEKHVQNVGQAAAIVSGFATGDVDLIGESMSDVVVEPVRATLIPGFQRVKENALRAGACGVAISGAGPAVIAIINRRRTDSRKVRHAMRESFKSVGVDSEGFITKPGKGACLLEMEK